MKSRQAHILKLSLLIGFMRFFNAIGQTVYKVPNRPINIRSLPLGYKEFYSGKDFDYVDHISFWQKLKAWLFEKFIRFFSLKSKNAYETFEILKFIFFAIIIIAVIYYIVKLIINKEGRWLFSKNKEAKNAIDYEEVQNIQELDFKSLISEAEDNTNYRLAIKFYYLYILKKMDESEIINYDSQKTSHDYLLQLETTKYYQNFSKVAYYYTYIWYGEFKIDTQEYKTASSKFTILLNQLGNG